MTDSTQAYDKKKILGIFEEYESFFASYELLILAKRQMEKCKIITGMVTLSSAHKTEEDKIIHRIDDELMVIKSIRKATQTKFVNIINMVGMGTISVAEFDIDLSDLNSTSLKKFDNPNWNHYGFSLDDPWPAAVFLATGNSVGDIIGDIRTVDSKIASHPQKPFFNLDELSKYLLHVSTYAADVARLYVVIPYYKKLQSIQLRGKGQLNLQLIIHRQFNLSDFRVSALYFDNKGKQVHSTPNITIPSTIRSVGDFKLVDILIDTKMQDTQTANISLIYKEKLVQTYPRIKVLKEASHHKRIVSVNPDKEKTLIDYLKEGESRYLEFKSSMLWDKGKSECSKNNYLELEIFRTIAAFMNSDGGILLVGIDPNQKIIGIEQDFQCIGNKNKNWDGWQQYLQAKIRKYIKNISLFDNVRVNFMLEESKTIARIEVDKGLNPVNVEYIENGTKTYEFYIRGFNGNELLNPNDTFEYIQKHCATSMK
jgi:hypothetical protein